jgi:hypothetical protein
MPHAPFFLHPNFTLRTALLLYPLFFHGKTREHTNTHKHKGTLRIVEQGICHSHNLQNDLRCAPWTILSGCKQWLHKLLQFFHANSNFAQGLGSPAPPDRIHAKIFNGTRVGWQPPPCREEVRGRKQVRHHLNPFAAGLFGRSKRQ